MGHSLAVSDPRSLAKTHRRDLDGLRAGKANLRIDANSGENRPESRKSAASCVRTAMRAVGLSQKAFAINAHQTESVVSEALSGSGARNIALEWIHAQDVTFITAWVEELSREKGLTPRSRSEVKRQLIVALFAQLLELVEGDAA